MVFGFFQMAGFNRYKTGSSTVDFLDVLQRLDHGWSTGSKPVLASRDISRPAVKKTRPRYVKSLDEILPEGKAKHVRVGLEHEYLPFSMAKLRTDSCERLNQVEEAANACGIIIEEPNGCVCWINMPTFKSNSLFIRMLARFAAMIKVARSTHRAQETAHSLTQPFCSSTGSFSGDHLHRDDTEQLAQRQRPCQASSPSGERLVFARHLRCQSGRLQRTFHFHTFI